MQTIEIPTLWRLSFFLAVCKWISVISECDLEPNVLDLVILLVLNPDFWGQVHCVHTIVHFFGGAQDNTKANHCNGVMHISHAANPAEPTERAHEVPDGISSCM